MHCVRFKVLTFYLSYPLVVMAIVITEDQHAMVFKKAGSGILFLMDRKQVDEETFGIASRSAMQAFGHRVPASRVCSTSTLRASTLRVASRSAMKTFQHWVQASLACRASTF